MTKVICLVGASGSGKTTIAKELEKTGYNIIQSYTTRKPRYKDEWGHIFIEEWTPVPGIGNPGAFEILDINQSKVYYKSDMIGYKELYGDIYFATDKQVIRGKSNIYIVDPDGAEQVHDFYKDSDIEVITVYLQVDLTERHCRIMDRGEIFKKAMDRIRKDIEIFQIVKCDYVIDGNRSVEEVLVLMKNII